MKVAVPFPFTFKVSLSKESGTSENLTTDIPLGIDVVAIRVTIALSGNNVTSATWDETSTTSAISEDSGIKEYTVKATNLQIITRSPSRLNPK